MFRQLPNVVFTQGQTQPTFADAKTLFECHPSTIAGYMEAYWDHSRFVRPAALGSPEHRSAEPGVLGTLPQNQTLQGLDYAEALLGKLKPGKQLLHDHLIYAYMVENTRCYEIFRRVVFEYRHGEKLGTPLNAETQQWLRATEELFFNDGAPFAIAHVSSHLRLDLRANRRNAYLRMFGMDLNHGGDDGKPYAYVRAEAANNEFVATFEEFLREVWVGITYVTASASANPTDDSKIATLAKKLNEMLLSRRYSGNLSREEFAFVSMMSWFHLTLELNSPVLQSLRVDDAQGPDNRLFKIAERVGLPAHGMSKSFFDIADPISRLLIQIELGAYNDAANVRPLYDRALSGPEPDLRSIITHWSSIRGVDIKSRKVSQN
jgi:hypothetical protein